VSNVWDEEITRDAINIPKNGVFCRSPVWSWLPPTEQRDLQNVGIHQVGHYWATCISFGQGEQACAALSAAIALYRAMDMTFWLPQAEAALAQVEER
jgi:hypothetical protein